MLVDSHAHLDSSEFQNDRDQVIRNSGLDYILNVATDLDSLKLSIELAEQYDFIYICAGIHPHSAGKVDFIEFQKFLDHPKIKAIGEIGLDYYRKYSPRDKQEEIFRNCLQEAEQRKLPVVIHQRNAQKEIVDILRDFSVSPVRKGVGLNSTVFSIKNLEYPSQPSKEVRFSNGLKGVMHCFSGSVEYAQECISLGFYISFAGNITYPKATFLREVAKDVSMDRLLIETDCPWLAPQPVRGRRNEPAFVKYVAEELARIKDVSLAEVGRVTGENFKRLFCI